MDTGSVIQAGDLQMMSAGTGITHSEFNHSTLNAVHFLQIWIVPNQVNVAPRYQQRQYRQAEKRGQLKLIISANGEQDSLSVYQDLKAYAGLFDGNESATLLLAPNRFAFVQIASGSVMLNGHRLYKGDSAKLRDETAISLQKGENAELLVFDLRPIEAPQQNIV